MAHKVTFDKTVFYVSDNGNGTVSGNLIGITKFYNGFLKWNRKYKPEKIDESFLRSLV